MTADPLESETKQAATEYQKWVDLYARKDFTGRRIDGQPSQLKIVITFILGDDKVRDEQQFFSGITVSGTEVTTKGHVSTFSHDDFGSRGGWGGDPIPEAELKRLDELLSKLPDDGSRLPPAGRRMMIQAVVAGDSIVRVYDRADAPDIVWEFLQLSRCRSASWLPHFQPVSEIEVEGFEHGGFFRIAPAHTQLLFSSKSKLYLWEPAAHEFLSEIRTPGLQWRDIAFGPDGKLAAVVDRDCHVLEPGTWKQVRKLAAPPPTERRFYSFSNPQFIQDGRYLLLQSNEPALWVFDTQTWQRVKKLPAIPENALQYFPSPSGKLAVVRFTEGAISLWDVIHSEEIAKIARSGLVTHAAFSPDEKMLALATIEEENGRAPRVRVCNTMTGKLVIPQLRPYQQPWDEWEQVKGLTWSPDGRYILAANSGIGVYNVASGRHRGNFSGPISNVKGFGLLPEQGQLVAGSNDGKIYFWDWKQGMKQIAEFEASLAVRGPENTKQR